VTSDEGLDRLDAICMMLIAIGESCKHLDKITDGNLLARHPSIDWKVVKGIRDIMSHQYFDIDADVVFSVCRKHIPELKAAFFSSSQRRPSCSRRLSQGWRPMNPRVP
jgi:uncharacterized protein with HEPN domain